MEICQDVPPPVRAYETQASGVKGRPAKYPWKQMQPGDSLFVPNDELPKSKAVALKGCARREFGSGNYTIRKEADGIRVWRLA